MAKELKEGDTAPAIKLETDSGETVELKIERVDAFDDILRVKLV